MRSAFFLLAFYVFSHFSVAQNSDKILLLTENSLNCYSEMVYDDSLVWYGVYDSDNGQYLEQVRVYIKKSMKTHGFIVKTNKEVRSIFLIGVKKRLNMGTVSALDSEFIEDSYNNKIYPGQHWSIYVKGSYLPFNLFSTGHVIEKNGNPYIKNYKLHLNSEYGKSATQDLTEDVVSEVENIIPHVEWFGDLDGDQKPDFLLSNTYSLKEEYILFLSSKAKENNYVAKVASFWYESCF